MLTKIQFIALFHNCVKLLETLEHRIRLIYIDHWLAWAPSIEEGGGVLRGQALITIIYYFTYMTLIIIKNMTWKICRTDIIQCKQCLKNKRNFISSFVWTGILWKTDYRLSLNGLYLSSACINMTCDINRIIFQYKLLMWNNMNH